MSLLVVPALAGYWVLSRTFITHFVVDRDPANLRFRITANYVDLLSDEMAENYAVTIAMKEIVSIARFDRDVYEKQAQGSVSGRAKEPI